MQPSSEEIKDVAIELVLPDEFIEKDWYAVQLLKLIIEYQFEGIHPIFSGGTSLSKGFGLIKRFSEDLDFKIRIEEGIGKKERRNYRKEIIEAIDRNDFFEVDRDSLFKGSQSMHFSFLINYPNLFEGHNSLRPQLKIEMYFYEPKLEPLSCSVRSFIKEVKGEEHEIKAPCVSPTETAADKCTALIWKTHIKDRSQEKGSKYNEPEMVRHLHDLCALEDHINNQDFINIAKGNFGGDKKRGKGQIDDSKGLKGALEKTIEIIQSDREYIDEFKIFVDEVSYAEDAEKISLEKALASLIRVSKLL